MNTLDFRRFINLTELDDKDAEERVGTYRDMIQTAESHHSDRMRRAQRNFEIYKNQVWDEEDLEFFEEFNITPYQFSVARPMINNLIARQRNRRFAFEIVPRDTASYRRFDEGKQLFIENHLDEFTSLEEAEEYYDEYADDEYANMINALLSNVRYESDALWKESECFQSGLVTGGDFMKATMSRKNNTAGSINIERKSQRQILFDPMSIEYDLSDAEYIAEVHLMYVDDLIQQYPEHAEVLAKKYESFTNDGRNRLPLISAQWKDWFRYDEGDSSVKLKVIELWHRESEKRMMLLDNQTGEKRLLLPGITLEQVTDQKVAEMLQAAIDSGQVDINRPNEDLQREFLQMANERYDVEVVYEPVWKKCVFTMGAMLEYKKSPYSHGSHPYTPFWAQHADGYTTGLIDDIYDIIIALNKALAFREMLMAHSSKGMIIVDQKAMADSGYSIAEIAEAYTQVGSVIAMKPKPGRNIGDVIQQLTTVGDGIGAINSVIADYENRLYQISGVNLAQLGMTQGETPASRYRLQISEGENNNALIFDNFVRAMQQFYNEKVIPLLVDMAKTKKNQVVRMLGDHVQPWIQIDLDPDNGLYADTLRKGAFSCVIVPREDNAQLDEARSAKYMELAVAGAIPIEVAIESSNDPDRQRIVKKIRRWKHQQRLEEAKNQVDIQQVMQIMMQQGVTAEQADEIIKQLRIQNTKQSSQQSGAPGMQQVSQAARQPERLQTIENTTNGIQ